ncbi:MAG: transposase, partial [Patescibacteria group bacterium]|nr:transposase [Patescibacteria group bacterium]
KIIGGFKAAITKEINQQFPKNNFQWQRSFYDHIIRKDESLNKIREYIMINPQEWNKDENNPLN